MIDVVLGADIGGTNTVFGLVDLEGTLHMSWSIPTKSSEPAEKLIERMKEVIDAADLSANNFNLIGIGAGAPNANYYTGYVENPPNLEWGTVDLKGIFQNQFSLPSAITNDANAAALGEMLFGAAIGKKDFIEITLGTGLGSGVVVDENVVYGKSGFAGELGHVIVIENGRKCGCGRNGCLETYASASGIRRTAFEVLANKTEKSLLRDISFNNLTSKSIYDAAEAGDKLALEIFERTGEILGKALANATAYLSPEAIVLFGGLADARHFIFEPTIKYFNQNLLPIFKDSCEIIPSKLPASTAPILGSAALIWKELNKSQIEESA